MTKLRTAMLGCWGIGGTIDRSFLDGIPLVSGPFAGSVIPSVSAGYASKETFSWRLPPLARYTPDGVDLMPFLLFDQITIDKAAFDCFLGVKPSLRGWQPSKTSIDILERLVMDEQIVLEDYSAHLTAPDLLELVDLMTVADLQDEGVIAAAIESMELWIEFQRDLLKLTGGQLAGFSQALAQLRQGRTNTEILAYVYECLADINRVLAVSERLGLAVYDWEDYRRFYRQKFLRSAKVMSDRSPVKALHDMFSAFLPNFQIRSYNELIDLRNDRRLDAVRTLIAQHGDKSIDKDLVIKANQDVLRIRNRVESFSRYIGYLGYLNPIGTLGDLVLDGTVYAASRWLERKVQWQTFFVERAIAYNGRAVEGAIEQLRNSG